MTHDILHIFMFSANLIFIVTSIYGWLLKRFHVPHAYKDHLLELYPAHRLVAALYLAQLVEIPYLLMIGEPDALFYANGIGVLIISSFSLVMVWGYFFLRKYTNKQLFILMLPVIVTGAILTLPLLGFVPFSRTFQHIMFVLVTIVSGAYIYRLIRLWQLLHNRILEIDEDEYSNIDDFPVRLAQNIKWSTLVVCLVLYSCFIINDEIAKMVRDILYSVASVWFIFYTLNPHRKLKFTKAKELEQKVVPTNILSSSKNRLSNKQSKKMEGQLLILLLEKKIFLEEHLTMGDLAKQMNTNKNYLSEVIARSEFHTFYKLINTYRIEYACDILSNNPMEKLEQVAITSGFTSGSAFSQVFKRIKNMSPSAFVKSLKESEIHRE